MALLELFLPVKLFNFILLFFITKDIFDDRIPHCYLVIGCIGFLSDLAGFEVLRLVVGTVALELGAVIVVVGATLEDGEVEEVVVWLDEIIIQTVKIFPYYLYESFTIIFPLKSSVRVPLSCPCLCCSQAVACGCAPSYTSWEQIQEQCLWINRSIQSQSLAVSSLS